MTVVTRRYKAGKGETLDAATIARALGHAHVVAYRIVKWKGLHGQIRELEVDYDHGSLESAAEEELAGRVSPSGITVNVTGTPVEDAYQIDDEMGRKLASDKLRRTVDGMEVDGIVPGLRMPGQDPRPLLVDKGSQELRYS